jgi:hypothetical protein
MNSQLLIASLISTMVDTKFITQISLLEMSAKNILPIFTLRRGISQTGSMVAKTISIVQMVMMLLFPLCNRSVSFFLLRCQGFGNNFLA